MLDPKTAMVGGFVADSVVHHFSIDSGYVTEIIPKVKAASWDIPGLMNWSAGVNKGIGVLAGIALGYYAGQVLATNLLWGLAAGPALLPTGLGWVAEKIRISMVARQVANETGVIGGITRAGRVSRWLNRQGQWLNEFAKVSKSTDIWGRYTTAEISEGYAAAGLYGGEAEAAGAIRFAKSSIITLRTVQVATIISFIMTEVAIQMLVAAMSETNDAARACYIAPLSKHNRPFVAGITGWRGSVIMHGQIMTPSAKDNWAPILRSLGLG
jgi:hypothetical protein